MAANPFAAESVNPFVENGVPPADVTTDPNASLTGASDSFTPQYEGRAANPFMQGSTPAATVPVVQDAGANKDNPFSAASTTSSQKEEELARKERDLLRRQEELNRREAQLPQANKKNFPKLYPLVYHNIEEDIPLDKQRVVRLAFYSFLGLCVCLAANWFAVTCELFSHGASETAAWLYAGIYVVLGVLGAWYLWYSRLYHACKGDRGLTFFFFFMAYSVHCAFCLWASLAPPGLMGEDHAFTGIFSMIEMFNDNGFIGFLYMLGMFCWIFETVLSAYVMRASYRMFRGAGHSTDSVQAEVQRSAYGNLV